jgi:PKD repeat protein
MNRTHILPCLLLFFILTGATNVKAQKVVRCYADEMMEKQIQKDPSLLYRKQHYDEWVQSLPKPKNELQPQGTLRVIPVVFHIIHEGGVENIPASWVKNQLDSLNKDFRRLNADSVNTPSPFKSKAADCNIEFRLAQLDPNGNCTDGIVRVFSHETQTGNDDTKALSYWPSANYFNIWVVANIEGAGAGMVTLGYAQFPGFGPASTDGVMLRYDVVGCLGADPFNSRGRTLSHETGHWLGLRHIWGDQQCGDDGINDTPPAQQENWGCPTFPHNANSVCGSDANGEMFTNYMDYSDGACQNMFTSNQKTVRMDQALAIIRSHIISTANLIATGTNGTPAILCAPVADFTPVESGMVCAGTSINFSDASFNGTPASWNWTFTGGTPATSTQQNPTVQYNAAGTYGVSLTVTNAAGTSSRTRNSVVYVSSTAAMYSDWHYYEPFESGAIPNNDWLVRDGEAENVTWQQTTSAYYAGHACAKLNNLASTGEDDLISPSFNLSTIPNPTLYWKVAYVQKTSSQSSQNKLKVYVSTDCGKNWTLRSTKTGGALATAVPQDFAFKPTELSEWRQDYISLAAYGSSTNLRVMFRFVNEGGNNIYLDDINIWNPAGIMSEKASNLDLSVVPNPVEDNTAINFNLLHEEKVKLLLVDMLGREVALIHAGNLQEGQHSFKLDASALKAGIYFVKLDVGGEVFNTKVVK